MGGWGWGEGVGGSGWRRVCVCKGAWWRQGVGVCGCARVVCSAESGVYGVYGVRGGMRATGNLLGHGAASWPQRQRRLGSPHSPGGSGPRGRHWRPPGSWGWSQTGGPRPTGHHTGATHMGSKRTITTQPRHYPIRSTLAHGQPTQTPTQKQTEQRQHRTMRHDTPLERHSCGSNSRTWIGPHATHMHSAKDGALTAAMGASRPATTSDRRRLSLRRWVSGDAAAPPVHRARVDTAPKAPRNTATMLLLAMTWASTLAPQYRTSA